MTPSEISQMLSQRASDVARMLLPAGKLKGREWVVGNTSGEEGKSLGVCVSGGKAGVWSDWATGESGDMLDLWVATKNINLGEAITEAKTYLGIADDSGFANKRVYKKPERKQTWKKLNSLCTSYITARGIAQETIDRFKLAGDYSNGDTAIIFPYIWDGELVMAKCRSITEKKFWLTGAEQRPVLFGWQALDPKTRTVAICEGEFDAMALTQYGIPALSTPFGGGNGAKHQWLESEWDNLDRFETIYICMDSDDAGRAAAKDLIDRIGSHRCRLVNIPAKDANECLLEGVPQEYIQQCFDRAVTLDPEELRGGALFEDEVIGEFYPEDFPAKIGIQTPWPKANEHIEFRMSELSLVNGVNGHGKSQVVGHLVLEAMKQGHKCCIASLELTPGRLLGRLTGQACGLTDGRPSRDYIKSVVEWYQDKLWLFNLVGTAKQDRLLDVFTYARKRYGITCFVIDSLLKCGIGEDDYNAQKLFVERLCDFKTEHDCHVFLVSHSRKGENEFTPSGKFDVRGATAITDLVDNVFICHRNKRKEKDLANPKEGEDIQDIESRPDAFLICEKQRNGTGWEGSIALWFDQNSKQFLSSQGQRPYQYVRFNANNVVSF